MSARFSVGDTVLIRENLVPGRSYAMSDNSLRVSFVNGMKQYLGKYDVISGITEHGVYMLQGNPYYWSDDMFEEVPVDIDTLEAPSESELLTLLRVHA